ncbi:MAG TPA: hypothetical protein VIM10_00280 [Actinopolymorphaceae bacterium]
MVSITVVVAGLLAAPAVAQAAPSPIAREQARGSHCVVALSPGSAAKRSVVKDYRCFSSLSEAVTFATGGKVRLGARSSFSSADTALLGSSSTASAPVLGIEYNWTGFGGTSLTLTGSGGSGCYGGTEYSFGNLGTYGWNDKIESARTYSNCVGVHYKNSGLWGTSTSVFGSKSDFGSLNNEISSIRFF